MIEIDASHGFFEATLRQAPDPRGIENKLHYRRDWSFDEDRCHIRHPNGAQVMAALRNLAISWAARRQALAPRQRARTLPQLQRRVAKSLRAAVAAITNSWN